MNKTNNIGTIILNQNKILIRGDIYFITELENNKNIQEIDCINKAFIIKTSQFYYLVNNSRFLKFDINLITKKLILSDYFIFFSNNKIDVYDDTLSLIPNSYIVKENYNLYIAGNRLLCKDNNNYYFYLTPNSTVLKLNDIKINITINNGNCISGVYNLTLNKIYKIYSVNEGYLFVMNDNKLVYWNETIFKYNNNDKITIDCEETDTKSLYIFILNLLLNNITITNLYSSPKEFYIKNEKYLHVFPYTLDTCDTINKYIYKITNNYYDITRLNIKNIVVSDYLYFLKDDTIYTMNYSGNLIDDILIKPIPDINKGINNFYPFDNGLIYNNTNYIKLIIDGEYHQITTNQATNFVYMYNKITKDKSTLLINYIETNNNEYLQLNKNYLNIMFKNFISTSFQNLSYKHINEIMKLYLNKYIDIGQAIVLCNINLKFVDEIKTVKDNNTYYKLLMKNILEQNYFKIFDCIYKTNTTDTIDYNIIYNYLKKFISTDINNKITKFNNEQKCNIINLIIPLYKYADKDITSLFDIIFTVANYNNLCLLLQIFQNNLFYKDNKQISNTDLITFISNMKLNEKTYNSINDLI
jgi:hypothetical protein